MTQRDDGHDFRDSKNKQEYLEKNKTTGQVKRIELGEVMYQFEEFFNSPKAAYEKNKQGDNPKFIVLEKRVQQVNIKPINEANIERGKDTVQSEKDIANTKSATKGKPTNE